MVKKNHFYGTRKNLPVIMWYEHLSVRGLIRSEYNTFQFNLTKFDWQLNLFLLIVCISARQKKRFCFLCFDLHSVKKPTQRQSRLVGRPRKKKYQGIHQLGLELSTVQIDILMRFYTNFHYLLVYFNIVWLLLIYKKNAMLQILLIFYSSWHHRKKMLTTENSDQLCWH